MNDLDEVSRFARPTAIVVSGGVSLGSHQGGLLHYLSQFLGSYSAHVRSHLDIKNVDVPAGDIRVATGASAGSINAFLSAMASCRAPVSQPTESLFFRTWIPVGMDGLARKEGVTAKAVLSRSPIDAAICRLRRLWQPDFRAGCGDDDISYPLQGEWGAHACKGELAFNVTRVVARDIPLPLAKGGGALSAKRQTEQFLVRYEKRAGSSEKPHFFPVAPPDGAMRALYPLLGKKGAADEIDLEDVFKVITASSSFPVAFAPVTVPHQLYNQSADGNSGPTTFDDKSLFLDGGVFDNTPLGVALTLSDWSCQDPYYVFVEPDAIGWQKAKPRAEEKSLDETIFGTYGPFVSDFITVSRQAELLNAIAQHEQIRGTLQVPPRKLPTASGQILNFLGFFERDFRRFDFYLGMTDGWDYLRESSVAAKRGESGNRQYQVLADSASTPQITDPMFDCFKSLRAAEPADFTRSRPDPRSMKECEWAHKNEPNLVALYLAAGDLRAYMQTEGWDPHQEQNQFFRFLDVRGFMFKDLKNGGTPVSPAQAQDEVRQRLQVLSHRLGMAQPGLLPKNAVSVATKAAMNTVRYRTSPAMLEVETTLNGAGLGTSLLLSTQNGYHSEVMLGIEPWTVRQLDMAAGVGTTWVMQSAAGLLFGKEWAFGSHDEPPSGRWQLSAAVGADGRVVTRNHSWFPFLIPEHALLWRVGPTARLRLTFFQRLTAGISATYWPDDCAGNNACKWATNSASGLYPVVSDRFRVGLFLGWRFLDLWGL